VTGNHDACRSRYDALQVKHNTFVRDNEQREMSANNKISAISRDNEQLKADIVILGEQNDKLTAELSALEAKFIDREDISDQLEADTKNKHSNQDSPANSAEIKLKNSILEEEPKHQAQDEQQDEDTVEKIAHTVVTDQSKKKKTFDFGKRHSAEFAQVGTHKKRTHTQSDVHDSVNELKEQKRQVAQLLLLNDYLIDKKRCKGHGTTHARCVKGMECKLEEVRDKMHQMMVRHQNEMEEKSQKIILLTQQVKSARFGLKLYCSQT